jgi:multiubiquitin
MATTIGGERLTETTVKSITIFVNDKPFEFDTRLVTGSAIKAKAGVPGDSILYELRGENRIPIGDNEQITIHEKERFLDVPGGTVSA